MRAKTPEGLLPSGGFPVLRSGEVAGFCYPVVPKGRDRVRTQLSAGHTKEELDFAVRCFGEVKREMGL